MAPSSPLLERILGHRSDRPAICSSATSQYPATYGDLASGSAWLARRLLEQPPGPETDRGPGRRSTLAGASVGLLLSPGLPFVTALLGIWRAGGVAVPLSFSHTAPELAHILTSVRAEATVVDPGLVAAGAGPSAACRDLMGRLIAPVSSSSASRAGTTVVPPAAALEDGSKDWPLADAPALILFTSGTTGKPKGVVLSHAGVAATLTSLSEAWHWSLDDRLLHALPLYHTHGLIVALLGALWAGASVEHLSFDGPEVWEALGRVTIFMAVPTMYVRLLEALNAAPASRQARWSAGARALRLFTSGSAALPASVLAMFAEATGQTILERYGMTEIGMALSNPYDGPRLPGSVGGPLPGVQVDLVGEDERPTDDGVPGELRVRSPQLFLGYHDDPRATSEAFDAAGRFRTGDTGVLGPDGGVRLLGRTSVDILKSGGFKLSALEIEDVLRAHPAVLEIAVIGVPDPVWGDCVTACVVPRGGATLTLDDLQDFARVALAPYKLPRSLRLLDALPRNPMGKVQKNLLK